MRRSLNVATPFTAFFVRMPAKVPELGFAAIDIVTGAMFLLVSTLALVVVRYSRTYLAGQKELDRYARYLLLTVASVSGAVVWPGRSTLTASDSSGPAEWPSYTMVPVTVWPLAGVRLTVKVALPRGGGVLHTGRGRSHGL